MKHLLNVVKDIFDPRDHTVAPNAPTATVKVSFRAQVPYIKDQGQAGSCTAHAGTEMMELLYRMHPSVLAKTVDVTKLRFSPLFLYAQERMAEGSFSQDSGADSRTIFQVLAGKGCCPESEDTYNDKDIFVVPTAEEVQEASLYKIGAYHRILDVDTAKTVLTSGYSFTVGMPLFNQFESDEAAATGLIAMPSGTSIGGHEMHIVGANDSKEVLGEVGAFESQNSWSDQWGDKGFCWIPYSYLRKVWDQSDAWAAHFGRPWTPATN